MPCHNCNSESKFTFTVIIGGKKKEYGLCESCAADICLFSPFESNQFPLATILAGLSSSDKGMPIAQIERPVMKAGLVCPCCGMDFNEFMNVGRIGCAECYGAFKENLDPILESIHGSTRHVGRGLRAEMPTMTPIIEKNRLESELRRAIESEDYELAADLRDKLQQLT